MLRVRGSSYNRGITFSSYKFSIKFEAIDNVRIKIWMMKNEDEKVSEIFQKIMDIPVLRSLVLVYRNLRVMLFLLIFQFIIDVSIASNVEESFGDNVIKTVIFIDN